MHWQNLTRVEAAKQARSIPLPELTVALLVELVRKIILISQNVFPVLLENILKPMLKLASTVRKGFFLMLQGPHPALHALPAYPPTLVLLYVWIQSHWSLNQIVEATLSLESPRASSLGSVLVWSASYALQVTTTICI